MLCAVGDLIEDIVVQLHDGIRRDTDTASTIVRRRGGSAANVAYFAAKLTGQSRFVGCVGSDPLGDSLVAQLTRHGVEVCGERHGRTGCIVVMAATDGTRTMLTDRGSATELRHADDAWLTGVTVVHLPLYSFSQDPLAATARGMVRSARERDAVVSLDLSSVALIEQLGVERVSELLAETKPEVLFCTRAEAAVAAIDAHHLRGAHLVVVKDGANPVCVLGGGGSQQSFVVKAVARVVDATGAGDAFAAGFLTAFEQRHAVAECVARGSELAARVVMLPGATLEGE